MVTDTAFEYDECALRHDPSKLSKIRPASFCARRASSAIA